MTSGLDALGVDEQLAEWTGSVLDPRGTTPTGIPELDRLLKRGGLQPSTFCILTGRTSTRKTTVTKNLIRLLLNADVPVGMVGLDESVSSYVSKLASAITGINHEWIEDEVVKNNGWNSPVLRRIREAYRTFTEGRFTLSKGTRPTKEDLNGWLEWAEMVGNRRPQVVFIDYLSIMFRDKYAGQDMTRIPRLMEEIQTWTHDQDVTTIVLHQVGRANGGNGDMPMTLDGMKFGGEEMADIVMATYRPALDELGTKPFEEARAMRGDDLDRTKWEWHVDRVEKYRDSTFLQLLKNRPGTRIDERGIEMFSVGDSMTLLSEEMGGTRGMKARVPKGD